MGSLSVSDITRLLQISGVAIAILAVLLILFKIAVWLLRIILRRKMSTGNADLVGQQATVIKTVRIQKPGEIECEFKGQLLTGPAISDSKIRPGNLVLIYAAEKDWFKVRPIEYDYIEGKYETGFENERK